jgi:amino acid transporter
LNDAVLKNTLGTTIPGIGITVDADNLGFVTGCSLAVILALLYLAMRRQLANAEQVFQIAGKESIAIAYSLLSMSDMIVRRSDERPFRRWMRVFTGIPNILITAAVLSYAFLVLLNFNLFEPDLPYSQPGLQINFELILLPYIFYKAIMCWKTAHMLEKKWKDAAVETYAHSASAAS